MNIYERILKLLAAILKMVVDGARDSEKVAEALQAIVDQPVAMAKTYLHRLFAAQTIQVGATDGTETFASSGVFQGGVYGLTLPVGTQKPTPLTNATVYEQTVDGTFIQILSSLGEKRRCWIESQVVRFCADHRGKLRTDGYATFFELEGGFVADVRVRGGGRLRVGVGPLEDGSAWFADFRHRVVVPQQES